MLLTKMEKIQPGLTPPYSVNPCTKIRGCNLLVVLHICFSLLILYKNLAIRFLVLNCFASVISGLCIAFMRYELRSLLTAER